MNIQATKLEIMQYLLNSNKESVLAKIKSIIEKEKAEEITGYTVQGKPLTVAKMNERLAMAEEDIKAGRVISDEELAREIETW